MSDHISYKGRVIARGAAAQILVVAVILVIFFAGFAFGSVVT